MLPDHHEHPNDRTPDDQHVHGSEGQISHPKLNRRENQIGHKIDGKRQGCPPPNLATTNLYEDEPERHEDDRIKNLPDQSNGRWYGRPRRFFKAVVPVFVSHLSVFRRLRLFRFTPVFLRL